MRLNSIYYSLVAAISLACWFGTREALAFVTVTVQPGIFSGAVLHAGTTVSALSTPVRAGDYIEIYCTGLGPTRLSGGLSLTTATPTVYIGATPVSAAFAGLAPGFVGLLQVNVQVPAGVPAGEAAAWLAWAAETAILRVDSDLVAAGQKAPPAAPTRSGRAHGRRAPRRGML